MDQNLTESTIFGSPDFNASLLNYVRDQSLDDARSNPHSTFNDISIPIETKPNDGTYYIENDTLACCWIAISHGLTSFGEYEFVSPDILKNLAGFKWKHEMLNTSKPEHLSCLEKLSREFPKFQFQFFIGRYNNKQNCWCVTQDSSVNFGNGTKIIRIVNKGAHFEFITTKSDEFIRNPRTMTHEKVKMQQEYIENKINRDMKNKKKQSPVETKSKRINEQRLDDRNKKKEINEQILVEMFPGNLHGCKPKELCEIAINYNVEQNQLTKLELQEKINYKLTIQLLGNDIKLYEIEQRKFDEMKLAEEKRLNE